MDSVLIVIMILGISVLAHTSLLDHSVKRAMTETLAIALYAASIIAVLYIVLGVIL